MQCPTEGYQQIASQYFVSLAPANLDTPLLNCCISLKCAVNHNKATKLVSEGSFFDQ